MSMDKCNSMNVEEWTAAAAFATLGSAIFAAIISGIALWQSKQTGEILEEHKDLAKYSLMGMFAKEMVNSLDLGPDEDKFQAFTELYMMLGYMFEKMEEGPMKIEEKDGMPYYKFNVVDYQRWLKKKIKEETGEEPKDN